MITQALRSTGVILLVLWAAVPTWAQPVSAQPSTIVSALPADIPLFPLQDVMLFPDISRRLHVFEPRYQVMVADALKGDRIIGMVLLEAGHEAEYEGRPPTYAIGTAGVITDVQMFPDGRYDIVLRGLVRFRIIWEDQIRSYRFVHVETLPDQFDEADGAALGELRAQLVSILERRAPGTPEPPAALSDVDFVNALSQGLAMEPSDRQALLERDGPLDRARLLVDLLGVFEH